MFVIYQFICLHYSYLDFYYHQINFFQYKNQVPKVIAWVKWNLYNSMKHVVGKLTYFYLLFLRPLTNVSINLSIEKRYELLLFSSIEHSIIAIEFLFFIQ